MAVTERSLGYVPITFDAADSGALLEGRSSSTCGRGMDDEALDVPEEERSRHQRWAAPARLRLNGLLDGLRDAPRFQALRKEG
jgi:hypothetical protein